MSATKIVGDKKGCSNAINFGQSKALNFWPSQALNFGPSKALKFWPSTALEFGASQALKTYLKCFVWLYCTVDGNNFASKFNRKCNGIECNNFASKFNRKCNGIE